MLVIFPFREDGRPEAIRSTASGGGEGGVRAEEQNGFYFLPGRGEIIAARQQRYVFARHKFKRALRAGKILARLPFVRMIAVCNSLSYGNARDSSDIDLFVATSAGGVWWTRLWALLILKLARLRPGQGGTKNKICLSFFVDENNLALSKFRLGQDDIDFTYWLAAFYPLYDAGDPPAGGFFQRLWQANQSWLAESLPACRPVLPHPSRVIKIGTLPIFLRNICEAILRPFASRAEKSQMRLLPSAIKNQINKDTRVRVEPGVLKFNTTDRRQQYAEDFLRRYNSILSARHEVISHK